MAQDATDLTHYDETHEGAWAERAVTMATASHLLPPLSHLGACSCWDASYRAENK